VYTTGAVIAGKYRIERLLGEGGMGTVVAATHLVLGTPVALKLLHPDMAKQQGVVDRFLREARASAALRGDHVCRVSDVGVTDEGIPYIVMELLEGRDLNQTVKHDGPLPPHVVADFTMQACLGLAEAHAAGIVHRDIKPGNLFMAMRPDGSTSIKVLDFGVAKAPEGGDFSLTRTATVMGSPGYMSPEQLKSSKDVDSRSDLWSLGVVMYELVTGKQPFHGETITELALRVAMDPTPPLGSVPRPFADVVARCLEKDPARRYPDVAALANALAPMLGPSGFDRAKAVQRVLYGTRGMAPIQMQSSPSAPTTLGSSTGSVMSSPTARSWKLPALIGAAVAGGVIAVIVATSGGKASKETHVQAPAAAAPTATPTPSPSPTPSPAAAPAPVAATPTPAADTPKPAPAADTPKPAPVAATPKPAPVAATPAPAPVAKPKAPDVAKKKKPNPQDVGDSRF
jgi:serine/threonine-protein kinase